jgi:HemY protein
MWRLLRGALVLIALMALAGFAAWIADQPGRVALTWFGYRIEAPAPLMALGLLLLGLGAFILTWALAWAAALPQRRRLKRQQKGYVNFAAGMVAVAAGEADRALALADKARKQLDDPALSRLLVAHAAQLKGDAALAHEAYLALSQDPGTAFLGTRGLLADARRGNDRVTALEQAQRASRLRPSSPFAAEAELQLLVEAGDWDAARKRLELARKKKAVTREAANALSARLDLAEAQAALARDDRRMARQWAERAAKVLLEHPAPPVLMARAAQKDMGHHAAREAAGFHLKRAFARAPSEALAEAWLMLQRETPADRLMAAAEDFVAERKPEVASQLLLAAAALQIRDFTSARAALSKAGPSGGAWAARLLATLAEDSEGDVAAADHWRALAGHHALWQCGHCGAGAADWALLCPACGSFDTLDPTRLGEALPLAAPPRPLLLEQKT